MGPCDKEFLKACRSDSYLKGDGPNLTDFLKLSNTHPSCRQELRLVLQWHARVPNHGGRQVSEPQKKFFAIVSLANIAQMESKADNTN